MPTKPKTSCSKSMQTQSTVSKPATRASSDREKHGDNKDAKSYSTSHCLSPKNSPAR